MSVGARTAIGRTQMGRPEPRHRVKQRLVEMLTAIGGVDLNAVEFQFGDQWATATAPRRNARRADDPCDCDGCWACAGHVVGCTCDIDWDEMAERQMGMR